MKPKYRILKNKKGSLYYRKTFPNGYRIYSFSRSFVDFWTDEEEEWINRP